MELVEVDRFCVLLIDVLNLSYYLLRGLDLSKLVLDRSEQACNILSFHFVRTKLVTAREEKLVGLQS
jgi:hypothetical protein